MKPSLLAFLAASGGLILTSCEKKPDAAATAPSEPRKPAPEVMPPPALPEPPRAPAGPSARELELEKQVRALKVK